VAFLARARAFFAAHGITGLTRIALGSGRCGGA